MSDQYPHKIRVTRPNPNPAPQDPETGVINPLPDLQILICPADVQDAGEAIPRNTSGMPAKTANATAFVPPNYHDDLLAVEPHDVVVVEYPKSDRIAEGNVVETREFDDVLLLQYR